MDLQQIIELTRILFGIILCLKLIYVWKGRFLVWAHLYERSELANFIIAAGFVLLFGLNIFFTVGLFTPIVAVLLWFVFFLMYRFASQFGLEEIQIQILLFYFSFAGAGSTFSVDSLIPLSFPPIEVFEASLLPEVVLICAVSILLLSAGIEKIKSPMWRKGLGFYYFCISPQHRRFDLSSLAKQEKLSVVLNHFVLLIEVSFVFVLFLPGYPYGFFISSGAILFGLSLAVLFVFSWISEILILMFMITFVTLNELGSNIPIFEIYGSLSDSPLIEQVIVIFISMTLISGLWTIVFTDFSGGNNALIETIHVVMRNLARSTWGILPIRVFTELHMEGSLVYKTRIRFSGNEGRDIEIFKSDGTPGEFQHFFTYLRSTRHKICEICMELDENSSVSTRRRVYLKNLCYTFAEIRNLDPSEVSYFDFSIAQFNFPRKIKREWALNLNWKPAFKVTWNGSEIETIEPSSTSILKRKSGRELQRNSFEFDVFD